MDIITDQQLYGMKMYQDRLLTYHNWPKQIIPNKHALAQAGFYYTGQSDFTVCFACNLKVNQWERQDNPWDEHKSLSPDCAYIKMVGFGQFDHDEKSCESSRKITFGNAVTLGSSGPSATGYSNTFLSK